jgi:hypothetical protein
LLDAISLAGLIFTIATLSFVWWKILSNYWQHLVWIYDYVVKTLAYYRIAREYGNSISLKMLFPRRRRIKGAAIDTQGLLELIDILERDGPLHQTRL